MSDLNNTTGSSMDILEQLDTDTKAARERIEKRTATDDLETRLAEIEQEMDKTDEIADMKER